MAFVEISITKKRFFNKSNEEITAMLAAEATAKQAAIQRGEQMITEFPKWAREFMQDQAKRVNSRFRFDVDNDMYRCRVPGDILDAQDFLDDFDKAYRALIEADPDKNAWSGDHPLHAGITETDEVVAMADMEAHARGANTHPARTGGMKEEWRSDKE